MDQSDAEFTDDERMDLNKIEAKIIADLDANQNDEEIPVDDQTGNDPATQQATQPPAEKPGEQQAAVEHKGDPRAALRASRRAEKRAREDAERLSARVVELEARIPADNAVASDEAAAMAVLEADNPDAAIIIKSLKTEVAALKAALPTTTAQAPASEEFTPPPLDHAWQVLVDEIDELSAMQLNPDQTQWEQAKRMDAYLETQPKWRGVDLVDRLREATRRVLADLPQPPPAVDHKAKAREVIDNAPRRAIETLTDLRSGETPSTKDKKPDYRGMTDEQIIASL